MKCNDLQLNTVKILVINFLYYEETENNENFLKHITSIEKVLKLWRMQNLTLEGKITVFKALTISRIVYLALITNVTITAMKELNKIQK